MPEELNKEQQDFDDVFDNIINKTDEEIAEEEAKEANPKAAEESGDSTKEQKEDEEAKAKAEADLIKSVTGQEPGAEKSAEATATAGIEGTDLQSKIAELEAELKKEHQRTSSWDGRIKAANSRVKELEAENQALKDQLATDQKPAADEQSDVEVMETFKKTFPEFVDVLNIYDKKMAAAAKVTPAKEKPEVEDTTPAKVESDPKPADNTHMNKIRDRHPELDEMVGTGVLLTWVNQQSDLVRDHLKKVYDDGSADQVINLVSAFKEKSGWKSQLNTGDSTKEDKLNSMLEAEGDSAGPKSEGPDKDDFAGTAKDIGL